MESVYRKLLILEFKHGVIFVAQFILSQSFYDLQMLIGPGSEFHFTMWTVACLNVMTLFSHCHPIAANSPSHLMMGRNYPQPTSLKFFLNPSF